MGEHFLTGQDLEDALRELGEVEAPRVVLDASRPTLPRHDAVRHPSHYTDGPVPGIECVQVAQWFPYALGNVIKYVWRAGRKGDNAIEDLRKAQQYLQFEIDRLVQVAVQERQRRAEDWR